MKRQQGFAVLEAILVVVVVAVLGFAGWYVVGGRGKAPDPIENSAASNSSTAQASNVLLTNHQAVSLVKMVYGTYIATIKQGNNDDRVTAYDAVKSNFSVALQQELQDVQQADKIIYVSAYSVSSQKYSLAASDKTTADVNVDLQTTDSQTPEGIHAFVNLATHKIVRIYEAGG